MNKYAIEMKNLTKEFVSRKRNESQGRWSRIFRRYRKEKITAVECLNLGIPEGEFFALLGPNGAGKTTVIRMLCTLLEPTYGEAWVAGYDITREADKVRESIGVVLGGERSVYWKLTGRENLEYFSRLYHIPPRLARERIKELLKLVELEKKADNYVERYSSGMRHRLALAKGLLNNPPILLLDEPTLGLDPQSARHIRELLKRLTEEEKKTIILTTHYMEEADQLAERIGIVDKGKLVALDTPGRLKGSIGQDKVIIIKAARLTSERMERLKSLEGVKHVALSGTHPELTEETIRIHTVHEQAVLSQALSILGNINFVHVAEPTLEDVFVHITGKELRE